MKQLQLHVPVSNPRRRPLSSRNGQSPNFVARSEGFQSKDYRARGGKLLYECTEAAARKRSGLAGPQIFTGIQFRAILDIDGINETN